MEQRENLLEERERLKTEYTKLHNIWMDAFNKRNALLPKFHEEPDGAQMAEFIFTIESLYEYENALKAESEAFAKRRETWEKILEINAKLQ